MQLSLDKQWYDPQKRYSDKIDAKLFHLHLKQSNKAYKL